MFPRLCCDGKSLKNCSPQRGFISAFAFSATVCFGPPGEPCAPDPTNRPTVILLSSFLVIPADEKRRLRLVARALFSFLVFVVVVAVLLPALCAAQAHGFVRIAWLSDDIGSQLGASIVLAVVFGLSRKLVLRCCNQIASWLVEAPRDRSRWVIVALPMLLLTSYAWQLHVGISHRGVPGWVYDGVGDFIQPDSAPALGIPSGVSLDPFRQALRPDVLPFIHRSGFATSEVMFLGFKDGTVRPANLALAMLSWPGSTFGLTEGVEHGAAFLDLIRHNFERRRSGGHFFLPEGISYPSHLTYQKIEYRDYPPASDLVAVSFWTMTVYVDLNLRRIDIVGLRKIVEVHAS
jgi:hypothetical protein